MRILIYVFLMILLAACGKPQSAQTAQKSLPQFGAAYDNFLQYWKENTAEDKHSSRDQGKHEHVHIKFDPVQNKTNQYRLAFFTGRNNQNKVGEKIIQFSEQSSEASQEEVVVAKHNGQRYISEDGSFQMNGDTLWTNGFGILPAQNENHYCLVKCRYFAGWVEFPHPEIADSTYRTGGLQIHDQGGMAQLDFPGINYTAELTQLDFAHTIKIMKLAIYDVPLSDVEINSRSISYTWTSPEAKRLGINLRKVVSGWTLIEEGYINSENMKK